MIFPGKRISSYPNDNFSIANMDIEMSDATEIPPAIITGF